MSSSLAISIDVWPPDQIGATGKLRPYGEEASKVAIPAGFEPATRGVEIRYSVQLSYGTVSQGDSDGRPGPSCPRNMKKALVRQAPIRTILPAWATNPKERGCLGFAPWHPASCPPPGGAWIGSDYRMPLSFWTASTSGKVMRPTPFRALSKHQAAFVRAGSFS